MLSPQFAVVVRRDLPMKRRMFGATGTPKSVTFHGRAWPDPGANRSRQGLVKR
jgi:hypothetical protein